MMQRLWDFLGFPLRAFILNEKWQKKLGLTTLAQERLNAVLPHLKGRAIDIGCGGNCVIRAYRAGGGQGTGVDVFPFEGVDVVVDTTALPFGDGEFDSAVMMACLNHVPKDRRQPVLREVFRILGAGGRLAVTMINPFVGWFCHKLTWWDIDQSERGMAEGEEYGLPERVTIETVCAAGFELESATGFVYGLNKLFLFTKK